MEQAVSALPSSAGRRPCPLCIFSSGRLCPRAETGHSPWGFTPADALQSLNKEAESSRG